jgi:hypothetical protein
MPGEHKSVEPMAAITVPERTAAQHQSLLHFVGTGGLRRRERRRRRPADRLDVARFRSRTGFRFNRDGMAHHAAQRLRVYSRRNPGGSHSSKLVHFPFAVLRDGGLIVKRKLHRVAGLLEFHEWRKFRRLLLGVQHCHNQLASLPTEKLAKLFQIIDVIHHHLRSPLLRSTLTEAC